ncbi:hypothetical protein GCM10027294_49260 [Marinactinospora endophytica]
MTEFQERRAHNSRKMEKLLDYLVGPEPGDKDRTPATGMAMEGAVELYRLSLETPIDPAEMAAFKARFSELMQTEENRIGLALFLSSCEQEADRGRLDGYADACWSRSVLQIINDEFTPLEPLLYEPDREAIQDIDETLHDVADDAPPVREHEIPSWIPASHWWWRAPRQQDMSEEERRQRLEYDWYDWH